MVACDKATYLASLDPFDPGVLYRQLLATVAQGTRVDRMLSDSVILSTTHSQVLRCKLQPGTTCEGSDS